MIKKVILHIGHDKTATTSIQNTFKRNRHILDNYGYYYPILDGFTHHNRVFGALFKEDLDKDEKLLLTYNLNLSKLEEIRSSLQNLLSEELLKSSAHTFILSGESFPHFNQSELMAIKAFFEKTLGKVEFEIYAYTRNPVTYASSLYQQCSRLFPSDTKVMYFPYEEKITMYIRAFGKESINLYKFEDACKNPKGPVCFLLNKMGIKDEIINQMQILNRNESISDMAVDLLTFINREIPFTQRNLNKGLRKRGDCRFLRSLPGRKFQLLEEDTVKLRVKTMSNMIWLKNNFNISYSLDHKSPEKIQLEFDDDYVEKMIIALRESNPIIKKLVYDYIKLRISEADLDVKSLNNLLNLESHIKQKYYFVINLSHTKFAYCQRVVLRVYNLLKRSKALRWLKYQWVEKWNTFRKAC